MSLFLRESRLLERYRADVHRVAAATAAFFVLAPLATVAPPRAGILVPGQSLGGLELGATRAQVRAAWGARFGSCRGCRRPTWYFNFLKFEPEGAGVAFRRNRAVALFTVWAPPGWRSSRGLRIGDDEARAAALHGPLMRVGCGTYKALTMRSRSAVTAVYVYDGRVWGFGLSRPGVPVCR
jgi:hypothetical protein